MTITKSLTSLGTVLVSLVFATSIGGADSTPKTQVFTGKVQPLQSILEKQGIKLDPEASDQLMALAGDDGKVYLLIKDELTRMFFKDERLLNRPMQLRGRLLTDSNLLQVLEVYSLLKGTLHEVYYWCEVCTIRRLEKKICECCGGPMLLREEPVKR